MSAMNAMNPAACPAPPAVPRLTSLAIAYGPIDFERLAVATAAAAGWRPGRIAALYTCPARSECQPL
jgi:hypothetical protein